MANERTPDKVVKGTDRFAYTTNDFSHGEGCVPGQFVNDPRSKKLSSALGGGGRFAALSRQIAKEPGITNPDAVTASIGRKKYGHARFQQMADAGRRRA